VARVNALAAQPVTIRSLQQLLSDRFSAGETAATVSASTASSRSAAPVRRYG
jgi:hypothetical protein